MRLTFFHYPRCQTCVQAKRLLNERGYALDEIDVTQAPPSAAALRRLITKSGRPYTDFLNRSGVQYRERNMKDKVKRLSEAQVIELLAAEGRLIKRPIVTNGARVTVGLDEVFRNTWSGPRS